ncbi:hypothetical protein OPV22_012823 [Ensete ventricosum]|uniref:Uncharacterized protein n=1 Tax=Ensete ventricosum TaxID=4639 RepID=A0AAV8R3Z2_ENSVE|nr:hypothetical protein OPV22_012823 [Ensete ventricosum]
MSKCFEEKPALLGFHLLAEWEPHRQCWMGWPERLDNWRKGAFPSQSTFVKVATAISTFEPLTMCVSSGQHMIGFMRIVTSCIKIFVDRKPSSGDQGHQVADSGVGETA